MGHQCRSRGSAFAELKSELNEDEYKVFVKRVKTQWTDLPASGETDKARQILSSIVEYAISRLEMKAAALEDRQEEDAALAAECLSFDEGPGAEPLRRYELANHRALLRTIGDFVKLRHANEDQEPSRPVDPTGTFDPAASIEPIVPSLRIDRWGTIARGDTIDSTVPEAASCFHDDQGFEIETVAARSDHITQTNTWEETGETKSPTSEGIAETNSPALEPAIDTKPPVSEAIIETKSPALEPTIETKPPALEPTIETKPPASEAIIETKSHVADPTVETRFHAEPMVETKPDAELPILDASLSAECPTVETKSPVGGPSVETEPCTSEAIIETKSRAPEGIDEPKSKEWEPVLEAKSTAEPPIIETKSPDCDAIDETKSHAGDESHARARSGPVEGAHATDAAPQAVCGSDISVGPLKISILGDLRRLEAQHRNQASTNAGDRRRRRKRGYAH